MHYKELAERLSEYKGGEQVMGPALKELERRYSERGKAEGRFQKAIDIATNLKRSKTMSDEAIAAATSLTVEQVKAIPA